MDAKANSAKGLIASGTGTPRREPLYSDALTEACIFLVSLESAKVNRLLANDRAPLIKIGKREDLTISELAKRVFEVVGFDAEIV